MTKATVHLRQAWMPATLRCATYVRTAVETAGRSGVAAHAAQRDACVACLRRELRGTWIASYEDLGFPGFGLARPALQRLLADIDAGVIDVVVVLGVDRLSRSLRERVELLMRFQRAGVTLVVAEPVATTVHAMDAGLAARRGTRP